MARVKPKPRLKELKALNNRSEPDLFEEQAVLTPQTEALVSVDTRLTYEQLPLTPNGKPDRNALPRPADAPAPAVAAGYVPPRTPLECALAEMRCQLRKPEAGPGAASG